MKLKGNRRMVLIACCLMSFCGIILAEDTTFDEPQISPANRDRLILVKEFTTEDTQMKGDKSGNSVKMAEKKERMPQKLVDAIVKRLKESGYNAQPYVNGSKTKGAIVIDGDISLIHNGSGSARVWVGFGAGKAKMIATVRLYYGELPTETIAKEKIKAAAIGAAGVFGGGGNMEDKVNYNFARKVDSLLDTTEFRVNEPIKK